MTSAKLDELATSDWLDVRTRAVFVEFTLYNANVNLYGSVIMLVEFLSTGAPIITQVYLSINQSINHHSGVPVNQSIR